jgi:L-asparagine transporter-like permease
MNGVVLVNSQQPQEQQQDMWYWMWYITVFIWIVLGFIAFIWSIMCFGKSGTLGQQIIGLLLAVIFGPFYWIYYLSVGKYCR